MGTLLTPISARYSQAWGHQMVAAGTNSRAAMMASQITVLIARLASIWRFLVCDHSLGFAQGTTKFGPIAKDEIVDLFAVEQRANPRSQFLIGVRLADH